MSAYRTAIDETIRIINLRARYFRNLVVIVVAISAIVVAAAVITRSVAALCAWLILVPACGLFFYVDCRVLNGWRETLFGAWIGLDIDFVVLIQSIRANPALPKGTIESMLATLPSAGDLAAEQNVLTPTRRAIAALSLTVHRERADALLLKTIASGIVVGPVLAAQWMHAWAPLWGFATIAVIPVVGGWTARARRIRCEAEFAWCREQVDFSEKDYTRMCTALR